MLVACVLCYGCIALWWCDGCIYNVEQSVGEYVAHGWEKFIVTEWSYRCGIRCVLSNTVNVVCSSNGITVFFTADLGIKSIFSYTV